MSSSTTKLWALLLGLAFSCTLLYSKFFRQGPGLGFHVTKYHATDFESKLELYKMEADVRNVTDASVQTVGNVFSSCRKRDQKIGTAFLRTYNLTGSREVWIVFQIHPSSPIESGLLNAKVSYNAKPMFSTHYDLCKKFQPSLSCPVQPRRQTIAIVKSIPSYLPSGKYGIEAWAVDQRGLVVACFTMEMSL